MKSKKSILKNAVKAGRGGPGDGTPATTATGAKGTSFSREDNKLSPAPKTKGAGYHRTLFEIPNGPSMVEKITRPEWRAGMKSNIARGVAKSKELAKGPSISDVAKETKNTLTNVKGKVIGRAKQLYKEREQAQRNWERRPDNSNYYGSWTDFKDK